ncbi:Uncharacterized protein OS=Pseudomonas bauzanensis GN=CF98_37415 PE=4 SV=1: Phage_connect_1 [Gemmataceae bacterium]|nr:Uncharacterized protein OS=Pseudomonas bauzanensis GN=CF98_37415 PE=4 SV=1: Phage_connect_1 [Gemmataceae bacterium]VTU02426.1 Uncharacterized protein OS=Pseudomonas bauzanensis GN=CF98_37415 PE=4 SV=1: Phage_connect_1 [Gemmataceae bacterium]
MPHARRFSSSRIGGRSCFENPKYRMERIETITPPASTSVSTATLKAHLRLNDTSEDDLLADWLTAADDLFRRQTGYVLITSTYRLRLDGWPSDGTVYIPAHPVTAVSSVQYLDAAGTWQTVSSSDYSTDLSDAPARVTFGTGFAFLELHATAVPNVRVQFVAGHADSSAVPKLAAQAVKLLAAHWYNVREAYGDTTQVEVPAGWRAVCDQFRTGICGSWNEGA